MSIEAWVTDPAGTKLAHLDRSESSPFRRFAVSIERGGRPGAGSLEHHLDNQLIRDNPTLLNDDNLVWMRYRGVTRTWIIEERAVVLDNSEESGSWTKVTGRGVLQLIGDRLALPTAFDEGANLDPATWGVGDWSTKLDGSAASGQKVVPVTSTVGAVVGDPVQLTGGGKQELGQIASISAGVSVTLVDNLASSYVAGARIISAAKQWRRFVNRASGEMLWDLISETNAFITSRGGAAITRGTIETSGADGWTQDFRFDNLLEITTDVARAYGDVDMEGLAFSYYADPGSDLAATVILEEGADILRVERSSSVRNKLTYIVAEGIGEGVTAKLAIAEDVTPGRPRMAYLDAKGAGNLPLVQLRADSVLDENGGVDAIALDIAEERFEALTDFNVHDTVRVIAPSRDIDESLAIVALYLAESDDERVAISIDVNTPRQEYLLQLEEGAKGIRQSVGVRNRLPQGQLVPYSFSGGGVLDTVSPLYVFVKIPDRVSVIIEAQVTLAFRQFLAPATAAAGGGVVTSGASSASSSSNGSANFGLGSNATSGNSGAASAGTAHTHGAGTYADANAVQTDGGHSHPIPHTHEGGSHTHGLTYGTFEETMPASWSVTLRTYERVGSTWTLRDTVSGLTDALEDVDLTAVITGAGDWRLTVQSEAAQPNGGRLGCDVFGAVTGAIQSS